MKTDARTIRETACRSAAWLFGWMTGRTGVMVLTTFLTLLWFIIVWNIDTTFRSMSDWMLYAVNILVTLILIAPLMLTRKVWPQVILLFLLDILLEANLMYDRTYLTAIPASSYGIASNMKDFTSSIRESFRLPDAGFWIILLAGTIWAYRIPAQKIPGMKRRWLSLTAIIALVTGTGITLRGGFYSAYDRLVQSCYYYTCGTPTYTVGGHILYTWLDSRRNSNLSEADIREVNDWLAEHKELTAPVELPSVRKSLVLIICESLESWPIGAEADGRPITPYLNSLIADSTTFYAPHILTQVATGHSIDAQLLYTAGMYPTANSVYSMKYPDNDYPSLNKELRADRGTKSYLFTSDKIITWNQGTIARSFGYDSVLYRKDWKADQLIDRHLTDGTFLRQLAGRLKQGDLWPAGEPRMMTVITYTGHFPFALSEELRDKDFDLSQSKLPERLRDYIGVTHYVDSQLKTIIDYVQSRPDADDILIAIVGDHEGLGKWRKDIRRHSADAAALVSPGRFTPLIVLNAPQGGTFNEVAGQVDVYTTLLDMLGLSGASWRGMGRSLLATGRIPAAYTTLPVELAGDTTGVTPEALRHLSRAAVISDRIIINNLLRQHK